MITEIQDDTITAKLIYRAEPLFIFYVLLASSGAFGFIDIMQYGDFLLDSEGSAFARMQWPIIYALTIFFIAQQWPSFERGVRLAWPMMLWAGVAVLSILWSIDRVATFNGAGRFLFTMLIGVLIGIRLSVRELLVMMLVMLLGTVGISLLLYFGQFGFAAVPQGAPGIFFHKNMLGERAAQLSYVAVILLINRRHSVLAAAGLVVAAIALVVANSASSVVTAAILIAAIPFMAAFCSRRIETTTLLVSVGLLVVAMVAFGLALAHINPYTSSLQALDRDTTLTGRSDLWAAGISQFWDHPAVGHGFTAFWNAGVDWRTRLVLNDLGAVGSFHNTFIEIGIQVGFVGLAVVIATLIGFAVVNFRLLVRYRDLMLLWPVGFMLMTVINGLTEVTFFAKHVLQQIVLVALTVQVMDLCQHRFDIALEPEPIEPEIESEPEPAPVYAMRARHPGLRGMPPGPRRLPR